MAGTTKDARLGKRRWPIAGGVAGGLAVLGCIVVVLSLPALMKWAVVRAARARGVDVVVEHVDPGWGWVRLRDAEVALQGVDGVHARLARATVDLQGITPSRVEVRGIDVSIRGSAADVMLDVATFAKVQSGALRFPVVAEGVNVDWRERDGAPPWLEVRDALVTPTSDGVKVRAATASVLDVKVGPVGASWSSDQASAQLGFGQDDPDLALVRLDVPHGLSGTEATVTLRPMKLADVARPLGVTMPVAADAIVSGQAKLGLQPDKKGAVSGTMHLALRGWVPPHPKELDGIVFGDETTFDTQLLIDAQRKQVKLSESKLAAGAFVLAGGGTVDRLGDHASIAMDMSGAIACQTLAKSAVGAHVTGPLGLLIGDLVKGTLKGAVTVGVTVRADSRDMAAAEVKQTISIGCSLKL